METSAGGKRGVEVEGRCGGVAETEGSDPFNPCIYLPDTLNSAGPGRKSGRFFIRTIEEAKIKEHSANWLK